MKYFIEFNDDDNLTLYFDDKDLFLSFLSFIIDLDLPNSIKLSDFGKAYF